MLTLSLAHLAGQIDAHECEGDYNFSSSRVPWTYCSRPSGTMLSCPMYMSNKALQKFSLRREMLIVASAKSVNPGGKRPPVRVPSSAKQTISLPHVAPLMSRITAL